MKEESVVALYFAATDSFVFPFPYFLGIKNGQDA
jgi:hypothetical protein